MAQIDIRKHLAYLNEKYGVELETDDVSDGYHTFERGGNKMNELYHHGVKGMKWGVRKNYKKSSQKSKRHLGINEKGDISFIHDKSTNKAKIKFAAKTFMFASGIALSVYISKHPDLVDKGMNFVHGISNKPVDSLESYKVFSESLGRYLTEEELINKGLL